MCCGHLRAALKPAAEAYACAIMPSTDKVPTLPTKLQWLLGEGVQCVAAAKTLRSTSCAVRSGKHGLALMCAAGARGSHPAKEAMQTTCPSTRQHDVPRARAMPLMPRARL